MFGKKTIAVMFCGVLLSVAALALADGRGRGRMSGMPVPPLVEQTCGSCHMAYPAMLLPAASWRALVPDSGEHFGDKLPLNADELRQVREWFEAHAADRTSAKRGRKIMESLGGATPERITEVPYIIRKHRDVRPEVFKRASVGGFANCAACHPGASRGDFKDDAVRIPN